jgi:Xaa-Pro aminopeptidase
MSGTASAIVREPFGWSDRQAVLELDFPKEEYERRIAALVAAKDAAGLDGLIVHGGEGATANLRYLTGWNGWFGDGFLVVGSGPHDVTLLTNGIFHGEPMHSNVQTTWVEDVRAFSFFGFPNLPADLVGGLGEALAERGLTASRLGYVSGRRIPASLDADVRRALPEAELVDANAPLADLRRIKSPLEIEMIRRAAVAASCGMEAALAAVAPGATEHQVAAALHEAAIAAGADEMVALVQSGARSFMKNVWPRRGSVIEAGELVSIDSNGRFAGYITDHARSTVAGKATDDQRRALEAVAEAQEAGLAVTRPGATTADIEAEMRKVVKRAGYEALDFCTGHGFGLDLAESPWFLANERPLEAGQCFFIEPMIVERSLGTICHEDMVLVTPDGAELMTTSRMRTW